MMGIVVRYCKLTQNMIQSNQLREVPPERRKNGTKATVTTERRTKMAERWREEWEGFTPGRWNRGAVNVRDFIQLNYTRDGHQAV